jgi:hypothetical protein
VRFRAQLNARLERALEKLKYGSVRREPAPAEKSQYELIDEAKKQRCSLPRYKRLIRRWRTRLKRLESQDPDIYPLW